MQKSSASWSDYVFHVAAFLNPHYYTWNAAMWSPAGGLKWVLGCGRALLCRRRSLGVGAATGIGWGAETRGRERGRRDGIHILVSRISGGRQGEG